MARVLLSPTRQVSMSFALGKGRREIQGRDKSPVCAAITTSPVGANQTFIFPNCRISKVYKYTCILLYLYHSRHLPSMRKNQI